MQAAAQMNGSVGVQGLLSGDVFQRLPPARPLGLAVDLPVGRPGREPIDGARLLAAIGEANAQAKELSLFGQLNNPGDDDFIDEFARGFGGREGIAFGNRPGGRRGWSSRNQGCWNPCAETLRGSQITKGDLTGGEPDGLFNDRDA